MAIQEKDIDKQVEYYMNLPYTMIVKFRPEQGGYYVAGYVELPDLTMDGDTPEEAVNELLWEKPEWFETCLKLNIPIPLPVEPQKYSGKIVLRMSPSMHEALMRIANLENVSLNQYMVSALARAIGLATPSPKSGNPVRVAETKRKYTAGKGAANRKIRVARNRPEP